MRFITVRQLDTWLNTKKIQSIELAAALRISPSAISRWRERNVIPPRHQIFLQTIVGMTYEQLMHWSGHADS